MAIENGIDIKILFAIIVRVSAKATLNIYSHITTMQQQVAIRIDREIGGTSAQTHELATPNK